jgi:hypothetical protein
VTFTDELIEELIGCPKTIVEPPRMLCPRKSSWKKEFRMESDDGLYSFSGFITQNLHFQENFSIGLVFYPKDEKGRICLLRCNGVHGEHSSIPHHSFCHEHKVDAQDLNNGIKLERHIRKMEYSAISDAVQYFTNRINLAEADRLKYFPPVNTTRDL